MNKSSPDKSAIQRADVNSLIDRAQRGDKNAMAGLGDFFDRPEAVELAGNLARMAQDKLVEAYSGNNLLVREGITRKVVALRDELAGPNPTALERLLVEGIVACWVHVNHLEANYANKGNMSLRLADHYQRSISSAHRRYLSSIRTLATVRKLALPTLQVNIARKQVNVAAASVVTEAAKEIP